MADVNALVRRVQSLDQLLRVHLVPFPFSLLNVTQCYYALKSRCKRILCAHGTFVTRENTSRLLVCYPQARTPNLFERPKLRAVPSTHTVSFLKLVVDIANQQG